MDLELLNYLITKLEFSINGNTLNTHFPACDEDSKNVTTFPLSNDTNKILSFFGYDTSVKTNHLTEKSLFTYLASNKKLTFIENIKPAKNAQHQRFAKYLKSQYPESEENANPTVDVIKRFKDASIEFFEKKREYQIYEYQSKMMQKALQTRDRLKADEKSFARFMKLHGMNTVIKVGDDELFHRWRLFLSANWSSLDFF